MDLFLKYENNGSQRKNVANETFKMFLLKKVRSRFSALVTVFRLVTLVSKLSFQKLHIRTEN